MSTDFIVRLIGMITFAILGAYWGYSLGQFSSDQALLYTSAWGWWVHCLAWCLPRC